VARIEALAGPCEVLVSKLVTELQTPSEVTFRPWGTERLKGVPGEWELFSADSHRAPFDADL
jgi:class 3 adenylate cyclase